MSAFFPNSAYPPRTKQNQSGVVYDSTKSRVIFAEDIKQLDEEIVAVENWLIAQKTSTTISRIDSAGVAGSFRFNSTHLFVCIATNSWRRVALSTW